MDRNSFYDNLNKYKQNDELMHYGTLGQKWGVRKWQNYDGTFNEAGKERYFGKSSKPKTTEEEKVGSNKSNVKDYLKFRNKMLKQRTDPDLNKWYRDKMKDADKQLIKDAKRVDKQQMKMYKNQLKDFYDNPEDLVNDLDRMYRIGGQHDEGRFGSYGPKKSDNPNNKYQNLDGTLTQKGYKKFVESFLEDMDITRGETWDTGNNKIDIAKFHEAEGKRRKNILNEILSDDSIDIKKRLKSDIKNKNTRKNLAELIEYCKKNGIKEITEEMVNGNRTGQNYLGALARLETIRDLMNWEGYTNTNIMSYKTWNGIKDNVVHGDKNINKFVENNKNYKDYKEISSKAHEKYNDTAQEKFIELLEKELGYKVPTKIYNPKNGTRAVDMTKAINDPKLMEAYRNNFMKAADYANNLKEVTNLNEKAYRTLQKAESDTVKYLNNYLNSNAQKTVPGSINVNIETGKVGESTVPEAMAYSIFEDDFRKYEG